jgi:hypothetical protein
MKKKLAGWLTAIIAAVAIYFAPKPPKPTPTPTPSPAPSSTVAEPSPTILPTPPPVSSPEACILPPSSAPQSGCVDDPQTPSKFESAVAEAQKQAEANGFVVDGKVTSEAGYTAEVARILRSKGICATNESLVDEVWSKDSNGFSDHWDIVTAGGTPWRKLAARCVPAKF